MAKAASGTHSALHPPVDSAPASSSEVAGSDFEAAVLPHQAIVARLARRILAWDDDVAEVVQDVFLAAYRHWPSFRQEARVTTWLASITLNACRTYRRKRWLRFRWFPRLDGAAAAALQVAGEPESIEQNLAVRQAVRALPARYREVIVLRYLEGMGIEDMEIVLGRTRSTIDAQLSRGRALLKVSLAEWMTD